MYVIYVCVCMCVYGWMDRWMDGRTDDGHMYVLCSTDVCMYYVCMNVCIYGHIHVCMYVCIYIYIYIYIRMYFCMYVGVCVCERVLLCFALGT
jgi:nuclear pore complex protein Nup62